ncbi:MAG: nucleotidyltransferase domain-containing protein [Bacteroides sp.]|nr:nucleotidyltransferase domain-containing protein [Eubacterium sp.]MCM1419557.1 nucleotidyltransferase domain-containing protein [Roseburia sp.]MCM1461506.1 nucleotidyltransferase domain-containing protein [Bacteroides sp.]
MCVYKIEEIAERVRPIAERVRPIAERVRPIAERYGTGKIYLFGSYARGEATEESDIDLLVDAEGRLRGFFAFGGLYGDLKDALRKELDLVTLRQHRTITGYAFAVRLTAIFSAILHRFSLKGVSLPASNLYNLTKNLTATRTTIIARCSLKLALRRAQNRPPVLKISYRDREGAKTDL